MPIKKSEHTESEIAFLKSVGNLLGYHRNQKGESQEKVAEKMKQAGLPNFSRLHLSDIECGRANVKLYEVILLCNIYEITIDDVLKGCPEYKPGPLAPYVNKDISELTEKDCRREVIRLDQKLKQIYEVFRE